MYIWGRERREKNGSKRVYLLPPSTPFTPWVMGGWKVTDQNLEARDTLYSIYAACTCVCVCMHECLCICVCVCMYLSIWVRDTETFNCPWEVMTLKVWLWIRIVLKVLPDGMRHSFNKICTQPHLMLLKKKSTDLKDKVYHNVATIMGTWK